MGINKPDDYAARLLKARKRRNGKDPLKYFLIAAGCVIVILVIVLAGKLAKGESTWARAELEKAPK